MAQGEEDRRSGPMDRLKGEAGELVGALGNRAVSSLLNKVEGTTGRLTSYVEGGAGPGLMAAVTGAKGLAEGKSPGRSLLSAGMSGLREKVSGMFRRGGKGGKGKKLKLTNIVESIDVGAPVTLAYNQWTQYEDFPNFTKKVETAEKDKNQESKVNWKAQVFWSHRTWESTVVEQVPDQRIVWKSKGPKGYVNGAVTFHELGPNLTRILLVLEYHPQGLFEHTGNLWRAQGRRARLELKHFRRHLMTQGLLHPDDIEGWRGTIHDGEVVESHEDASEREQKEGEQQESEQKEGSEQPASRQRSANGRSGNGRSSARESRARESSGRESSGRESSGRESSGREPRARQSSGRQPSTRRRAGTATQRGGST